LHYVLGKKQDDFGNVYRYRSHVTMDDDTVTHGPLRRAAIDVLLADLGAVPQEE
jgi:hypothetical protein